MVPLDPSCVTVLMPSHFTLFRECNLYCPGFSFCAEEFKELRAEIRQILIMPRFPFNHESTRTEYRTQKFRVRIVSGCVGC